VRDSGRLPICLLPHPLAHLRTQTSCTRDPNSNLVFFHLPSYLTCPFLPLANYGDRYRHGEKISTAFAESAVNQVVSKRMVKKQQMRWTESGAHNLLQIRTKVLNNQLREGMQNEQEMEIQKKVA
jgi:hypothetical protein